MLAQRVRPYIGMPDADADAVLSPWTVGNLVAVSAVVLRIFTTVFATCYQYSR